MILPKVAEFLESLSGATPSLDGSQIMVPCYLCDGDGSSRPHLSVKLDIEPGEPMKFQCFRASCELKPGVFSTEQLRRLGCMDESVMDELAAYNSTIDPRFEKRFVSRESDDIALANIPRGNAAAKLAYIRKRLGVNLSYGQLKDLKIQLSLLDMLKLNDIKKLATTKSRANLIDVCCIGFVSGWNDYLICRDVTPECRTGMRYYNYKISGSKSKDAIKAYIIPRTVEILNPRSCVINVAEGPFSILGAYLNTDLGAERPNNVWAANCGSQYENTVMRICKQYGFLKVRINVFSDSEIRMKKYHELYKSLKGRLDIRRMRVYYNRLKEDFGYPRRDIDVIEEEIA